MAEMVAPVVKKVTWPQRIAGAFEAPLLARYRSAFARVVELLLKK